MPEPAKPIVVSPDAAALRAELTKMLRPLGIALDGDFGQLANDELPRFEMKLAVVDDARVAFAEALAAYSVAHAKPSLLTPFGVDAVLEKVVAALGTVTDLATKQKGSGILGAIEVVGVADADKKLAKGGASLAYRVGSVDKKLDDWFKRARKMPKGEGPRFIEGIRVELESGAQAVARWEAGEGEFEDAWAASEKAAGFRMDDPARAGAKAAARKAKGGAMWDAVAAAVRVPDAEKYLKARNKQLGDYAASVAKKLKDEVRKAGELRTMFGTLGQWEAWLLAQQKRLEAAPPAPALPITKIPKNVPLAK